MCGRTCCSIARMGGTGFASALFRVTEERRRFGFGVLDNDLLGLLLLLLHGDNGGWLVRVVVSFWWGWFRCSSRAASLRCTDSRTRSVGAMAAERCAVSISQRLIGRNDRILACG